jgi:hypothetical protein
MDHNINLIEAIIISVVYIMYYYNELLQLN